ncbi:MAG: ImmA/IrrE family metallo-endopeptidase [Nannocystaceae bacterium]
MPTARATAMNGKVLTWAREQAGLSTAALAELLHKDEAVVVAWEHDQPDEPAPTVRQLERIAELLKRPLAIFFFSEVPTTSSITRKFRMLPEPIDQAEARDTSYALREAHARQLSILELAGGLNPAGEDFLFAEDHPVDPERLRRVLGISLEDQQAFSTPEDAFKAWRDRIERAGVFVFKRAFKQAAISGFCLPHEAVPIIVVNNGTAWTRQIFTLFHELCHLAHHHYGVTRADHDYLDALVGEERRLEIECNRFASEFLVPPQSFDGSAHLWSGDESEVADIARLYNVSREVVLRRLLDLRRIDRATYEAWTKQWNASYYARPKAGGSGGNFYATTASYLGPAYLRLTFAAYLAGEIDVVGLAEHLGVKARQVAKLEPFLEATG